jgi:hypothetical protein
LWTFFVTYRTFALNPLKIQAFNHVQNVQKKSKKTIDTPLRFCEIALTHGIKNRKTLIKMRTKTLLIASAVALTAAITSSQAQTVYSANIVGYVNEAVPGQQYELYSPALDLDGTGTNGTVSTVVGTNVDLGTQVLIWNGSGYNTLAYQSSNGKGSTVEWVLLGAGGGPSNNYALNVGQGFFLFDPKASPVDTNITETGNVLQGTLVNGNIPAVKNEYSLLGSLVPIGGDLKTNLNYQAAQNDQALVWNGTGFNTYAYQSSNGKGSTVEWVLLGAGGGPADPQVGVGQGFFLFTGSATDSWTEVFTNN